MFKVPSLSAYEELEYIDSIFFTKLFALQEWLIFFGASVIFVLLFVILSIYMNFAPVLALALAIVLLAAGFFLWFYRKPMRYKRLLSEGEAAEGRIVFVRYFQDGREREYFRLKWSYYDAGGRECFGTDVFESLPYWLLPEPGFRGYVMYDRKSGASVWTGSDARQYLQYMSIDPQLDGREFDAFDVKSYREFYESRMEMLDAGEVPSSDPAYVPEKVKFSELVLAALSADLSIVWLIISFLFVWFMASLLSMFDVNLDLGFVQFRGVNLAFLFALAILVCTAMYFSFVYRVLKVAFMLLNFGNLSEGIVSCRSAEEEENEAEYLFYDHQRKLCRSRLKLNRAFGSNTGNFGTVVYLENNSAVSWWIGDNWRCHLTELYFHPIFR